MRNGYPFPLIVPADWQVQADGELVALPGRPKNGVYRIVLGGAFVAVGPPSTSDKHGRELLVVTALGPAIAVNERRVEQWIAQVAKQRQVEGFDPEIVEASVLATSPLSAEPVGKGVLRRRGTDTRTELCYFMNARELTWHATYALRSQELERWKPWFAEMEGVA